MAAPNVCTYYKFGHCKFRDNCKHQHIHEVCENSSCNVITCMLRHPKECKFYMEHNRCKFSEWCDFAHIEKENSFEKLKHENKSILGKLSEFENLLIQKDVKFYDFEKQIIEKNTKIEELNSKVEEIEKNVKKLLETMLNHDRKLKSIPEVIKFQCSKCNFESVSDHGLKVHIKRKHTVMNTDVFPKMCELCERKFENIKEMKKHMKEHSYKDAKFKCEECDFIGQNKITMENLTLIILNVVCVNMKQKAWKI